MCKASEYFVRLMFVIKKIIVIFLVSNFHKEILSSRFLFCDSGIMREHPCNMQCGISEGFAFWKMKKIKTRLIFTVTV